MKMIVRDCLPYGRENAVSGKVLSVALGLPGVRELQRQIAREREAGAVILSDQHRGGYYLSDDPEELQQFVQTMNAKARNTARAAQSAQRALSAATGQISIDQWYEEQEK